MRQRFIRISGCRRSAVYAAWTLLSVYHFCSILHLLQEQIIHIRYFQLFVVLCQGFLGLSLALATHDVHMDDVGHRAFAPLATFSGGREYLLSEVLRFVLHATLSWYPLEILSAAACHIPKINILMQQAVTSAGTATLGIPAKNSMQSLVLLPLYGFLDWRYASLNAIPGNATLLGYLSRRGALLLASKLFFSGIPALIMMRSNTAQQASGIRLFHGVDNVGLWEVWSATVVAFGIGTDVGHVVEELRAQFSKVRMIADDILPHHVVDTLMQQQQAEEEEDTELYELPDDDPDPGLPMWTPMAETPRPGQLEAIPGVSPTCRSLMRTSSLSSVPVDAGLPQCPQLRSSVSMSHPSSAPPEVKQLASSWSQPAVSSPAAGSSGSSRKPRSHSAELPLLGSAKRSPTRRSSAMVPSDEAEYAEEHPGACILFADVCGFTTISEGTSPSIIVYMLNKLFSLFDEIICKSRFLYKLDVIGDCYMVASGLHWHAGDPCPARTLIDFAKLMLTTAATVLDPATQRPLSMRCGIHGGPVVGALLGSVRRKYSLFGDAVNAASRLESTSLPGSIQVSAAIYRQLWQPCLRLDPHQSLERLALEHELRSVEEDGEELPAGPLSVPSVPVPAGARAASASCSGTGSAASTWGSLQTRRSAEEAEGRALEGMGLLAIGSQAWEDAGRHADAPAAAAALPKGSKASLPPKHRAAQDHLASDQYELLSQHHLDPSCVRMHVLDSMLSTTESVRSLALEQQHGEAGAGPGEMGVAHDPQGEELWMYRGRIELKGRAALETYILQVI